MLVTGSGKQIYYRHRQTVYSNTVLWRSALSRVLCNIIFPNTAVCNINSDLQWEFINSYINYSTLCAIKFPRSVTKGRSSLKNGSLFAYTTIPANLDEKGIKIKKIF